MGIKLVMTSTYHPQSDGQIEAINQCIKYYLRITHSKPKKLIEIQPWAEQCFNTSYQHLIKMLPFKALYGRDPPDIPDFISISSKVQ